MIRKYAKENNMEIEQFYIDDNVSGFIKEERRPSFHAMLTRVFAGEISVIIAKDLSRIGRRGGATLKLLDDLKEENVNLILLHEMGGTFNLLEDDDDLIGLSSWVNDRYVKDTSKKSKKFHAQYAC